MVPEVAKNPKMKGGSAYEKKTLFFRKEKSEEARQAT